LAIKDLNRRVIMLKRVEVFKDGKFNDLAMARMLVHDSPISGC
jgi:hypothetical protein